jgi:Protein of unknown function (DUF2605)
MLFSNVPDPELLKTLLEPLLDDFQYWLSRAKALLSNESVSFLSAETHADLLARVEQNLQEVIAAQSLFQATGCQVGIEGKVIMAWHALVAECWQIMIQHRLGQSSPIEQS